MEIIIIYKKKIDDAMDIYIKYIIEWLIYKDMI